MCFSSFLDEHEKRGVLSDDALEYMIAWGVARKAAEMERVVWQQVEAALNSGKQGKGEGFYICVPLGPQYTETNLEIFNDDYKNIYS